MKPRVFLNDLGLVCALGEGKRAVAEAMFAGVAPGMRVCGAYSPEPLMLGQVDAPLPELPLSDRRFQSRNNRLLLAALAEIRDSLSARLAHCDPRRVGIVLGTSTSGVAEAGEAIAQYVYTGTLPEAFHYGQMEIGCPARLLSTLLETAGPAYTVSTACTAGTKAIASAARLLRAGLCDLVIAGGVDSLCRLTVAGFQSLGAVSAERCNPFSRHRKGINIGEGAALFVMSREESGVVLLGVGESSDGYHISAPDPAGRGARIAIAQALETGGIRAGEVDYLNLHGTATAQNDAMEALVVNAMFGPTVACSSTKPLIGHTLGAAGAIEAGLCWLSLSSYNPDRFLPPQIWDGVADDGLPPLSLCAPGQVAGRLRIALSNSFAFGGNNTCLAIGSL